MNKGVVSGEKEGMNLLKIFLKLYLDMFLVPHLKINKKKKFKMVI